LHCDYFNYLCVNIKKSTMVKKMKRTVKITIDHNIRPVAKAEAIRRGLSIDDIFNLALRHAFKITDDNESDEEPKQSCRVFIDEGVRKWLDANLETGTRIYHKDLFGEIRLKVSGITIMSTKQLFIWLRYYCIKNRLNITKGSNRNGRWMIITKAEGDFPILGQ